MLLYSIYPRDPDFHSEALSVKVDNQILAVMAFKSETLAVEFMQARRLSPNDFAVRELTIEEFEKVSRNLQASVPGLTVMIKIME
jgi:hypothetical protein